MIHKFKIIGILIGLLSLTISCTATDGDGTTDNAQSNNSESEIVCYTAYRSSVTQPIENEDSMTIPNSSVQKSQTYADLAFHAQFWDGEFDGERALRLAVTKQGEPTTELTAQLYQLDKSTPVQNQFVGGHGFTGLNYVYHPESGAELQYWCVAQ